MDAHANFAYSTVATAPSPATSGTSLVVASGDGTKFPAVPFNATIWPTGSRPSSANAEIVRVTGISTDTLTITRTQESTSARSVIAGDQIAATITKKTLTDIEVGHTELVYRYTVTGSDKASIDTGVDTADAGSGDWANGDLLEVELLVRTDDAASLAVIDMILNNDSSAIYDTDRGRETNTTVAGGQALADTRWQLLVHGSGGSASYAAAVVVTIPRFGGTTFWKTGWALEAIPDATAGNNYITFREVGYRSTTAITRLKIAAQSTAKLKVGSQLLIYKRRS